MAFPNNSFPCPKGHNSTDPDYCSECGARLGQSLIPTQNNDAAVPVSPSGSKDICPDCGTPRTGNSRFCEVCRYDFLNNSSDAAVSPPPPPPETPLPPPVQAPVTPPLQPSLPPTPPTPPPVPPATTGPAVAQSPVPTARLNVAVLVDPSLVTDDSMKASCPQGAAERIFPLDLDENLVGRRSDTKGVYPEVEVNDPGVSHRHLKFIKQSDGTFAALELGSANGTELNGANLDAGVSTPVKAGDELIIGIWTRLQLRARA